jgi:hypothetical protein
VAATQPILRRVLEAGPAGGVIHRPGPATTQSAKIGASRNGPDARPPSISRLARQFRISRAHVRKVLRGAAEDGLIELGAGASGVVIGSAFFGRNAIAA